jgi:hypothetical protein
VHVGLQLPASPAIRVGVEAGFERSIHGTQSERTSLFGSARLLTSHRDTTVSGLVSWTPDPGERVQQTVVAGGTLALRHTVRQTQAVSTGTSLPPPRGPYPAVVLDDIEFGLVAGVDFPVRLSSRLWLIPTGRVHYLFDQDRDQYGGGPVKRGVGAFITRLGVGIGVDF